jgi:hypothetical protein
MGYKVSASSQSRAGAQRIDNAMVRTKVLIRALGTKFSPRPPMFDLPSTL